jgi:Plasmid encoded RepA protein
MSKVVYLTPERAWGWKDFLEALKPRVPPATFHGALASLHLISRAQNELVLGLRDNFCVGLAKEHLPALRECARIVAGLELPVVLVADDQYQVPEAEPQKEASALAQPSAQAQESLQKEVEAARAVGYTSRLLVQATLPHSKPGPDEYIFERSNGYVTIRIMADPKYGLPYGTYPRLILAFIVTEAVRTKSPIIELGASMTEFMDRAFGLSCTGGKQGSVARLSDHMQRLVSAHIAAEYQRSGEWQRVGLSPLQKVSMFWDPKNPTHMARWHSIVELSQPFFEEMTRSTSISG